jgi:hypothetical protein
MREAIPAARGVRDAEKEEDTGDLFLKRAEVLAPPGREPRDLDDASTVPSARMRCRTISVAAVTFRDVSTSAPESSGCRWRSRRKSTHRALSRATTARTCSMIGPGGTGESDSVGVVASLRQATRAMAQSRIAKRVRMRRGEL